MFVALAVSAVSYTPEITVQAESQHIEKEGSKEVETPKEPDNRDLKQKEVQEPKKTWRDNPNDCDMETQFIREDNLECLDKPVEPKQVAVQANSAEQIVRDFYLSQGFTPAATAYLMGTIRQESGFRPNAIGDGGLAHGIFQWHPNRRWDMPNDLLGQLHFSVKEMDRDTPGTVQTLKNSNDPNVVASTIKRWIRYGHAGSRYIFAEQYLGSF